MNQQHGRFHLVGMHKGRHGVVHFRSLPVIPLLGLKPERGERTVISTAPSNARGKQVGVRQQVRRHKGPVRVPAHGHPVAIDVSHRVDSIDGGFRVGHQLLHERVVRLLVALAHDRKRSFIQHRVTAGYPVNRITVREVGKRVGVATTLPRAVTVFELPGVSPHDQGELLLLLLIVPQREVERAGELQPIVPPVSDYLFMHPFDAFKWVLERSERDVGNPLSQVLDVVIWKLSGRFHPGD